MARLDPRRAKVHRSYTVAEAARLFNVHRNTVRHWIKGGLPVVRACRTVLILGRDLGPFLAERQARRRRPCAPGQLFCLKCREPRRPREGSIRVVASGGPAANVAALCACCGTRMHRRVGLLKLAAAGFNPDVSEAGGGTHSR